MQASDHLRSRQWQAEFKRLKNFVAAIPKDTGYGPVVILIFWVPDDVLSSELRTKFANVVRRFLSYSYSYVNSHITTA